MKTFIRILLILLALALLTFLTQVGGVWLLLSLPLMAWLAPKGRLRAHRRLIRMGCFFGVYLMGNALILPPVAKALSGRVPLPLRQTDHVQPLRLGYALLNRHYVRPGLKSLLFEAADAMQERFPGTVVAYLDAGFPLFDGYPLLPHRSHDDGRKVDFCFLYEEAETGEPLNAVAKSYVGYGGVEGPKPGERNQPQRCTDQGYWQYDLLSKLIIFPRTDRTFDMERNRYLLRWLATQRATGKIFIEPHLKTRLGLGRYNKIRFHGCPAVRHDDHIHLQL